jgi:hypothetical protein
MIRGAAVPEETRTLSMNGHPASVCCDPLNHDFFVASYFGDGVTRIYKIDGYTWDIVTTADVPGYPWDMAVSAYGSRLLVLSLE